MATKYTIQSFKSHLMTLVCFRVCMLLISCLMVLCSQAQVVHKRPMTSSAVCSTAVFTINKPEGAMPGDVIFLEITQHALTGRISPIGSVSGDGWTMVAETSTLTGDAGANPSFWKKTVLYHIASVSEPNAYTFQVDATVDFSAGSMVSFFDVDCVNGVAAGGNGPGPFDVLPTAFNIAQSSYSINANPVSTITPGAGLLMFSSYCGLAQFSDMAVTGNTANDLLMEMFDTASINLGAGISNASGFAVEELPGIHTIGTTRFNTGAASSATALMLVLKPLQNGQVNTQVIYPGTAFCSSSTDLINPQIIGRIGGSFSANSGLSIDTASGAINPSTSMPGVYTIRYFIAPTANEPGVDVTVFINIIAPPTYVLQTDRNRVCEGDTLHLFVNHPSGNTNNYFQYQWTGPNGFSSQEQNPIVPMFSSANEGVYTVQVNSLEINGCATTQSTAAITTAPRPLQAGITGDVAVCSGNTAHLYVNVTGGNAPYHFTYNTGLGTPTDTVFNYDGATPITRVLTNTTQFYLLKLISSEGCRAIQVDTTPATILVYPAVSASLSSSFNTTICRGAQAGLKVTVAGASNGATYTVKYSNGTTQTTINNYVSGTNIALNIAATTQFQLLSVQTTNTAVNCPVALQNTTVTITVNQPVSFSDLYVSSSNPICGGVNYRANLKINMVGGKVPYNIGLTGGGTTTNFIYDTTSSSVAQRFMTVRPVVTTQYKITSITDGNGCTSTAIGDTASVYVVPTATRNSGIYVRNLPDYRTICAGTNARVYTLIYRYTGNVMGTSQDYANRYTVILAVKMNGTLMRYDTIRNYLNRNEISLPTSMLWQGTLEVSLYKIINTLNCSTSDFSLSSAPLVSITVKPAAIPGNISGAAQVCAGNNESRLSLSNYSGSVQWYSALVANGVYAPIQGATESYFDAINLTQTTFYKALVTNGTCSNYSAAAAIQVSPTPHAGSVLGLDTTCMGEDVSVMLSNASGSIMWQFSNDGINFMDMPSDTGLILDIPSIQNSAYYQAVLSSGVCTAVTSQAHHIVVKDPGLWVGPTDNERWDNPSNWACGRVPDAMTNVTILSPGNNASPMIGANSFSVPDTAYVRNIFVAANATLNIFEGGVLRISGEILGEGNIDSRDGNIEMIGTADTQRITPNRFTNNTLKTLKVSNPGGVLSIYSETDTLKVSDKVIFGTSNATLKTNDRLVLLSNANGTASIADMTSNGVTTGIYTGNRIIGNVTVERYIPEHYKAWQFLAAPAIGQTIKAAWQEGNTTLGNNQPGYGTIITSNVPDALTQGYDIYSPAGTSLKSYNPQTNAWEGVPSTLTPIENVRGYMLFVRGDRSVNTAYQAATATTLRITGKLYTPIDNPPAAINVQADRFEAVGNPYASAIDFNKISKTGGVQDVFYVWDPRLTNSATGSYGLGAYQTFVGLGDGTYRVVPGGGSYGTQGLSVSGVIQSGQAFFVRAAQNDGMLSFDEQTKILGSAIVTRSSANATPRMMANLYAVNTANAPVLLDGAMVEVDDNYHASIDAQDILKINNSTENIAIPSNGKLLVADRRSLHAEEDTIWISMGQLRARTYQLEIAPENLQGLQREARLIDLQTGSAVQISLTEKTTIRFTMSSTSAPMTNRYCIVFNAVRSTLPVRLVNLAANRKASNVVISWRAEQESQMATYNIERSLDGKSFEKVGEVAASNNHSSTSYMYTDVTAPTQKIYYRIRSQEQNGQSTYTSIVSVRSIDATPGMLVYPNPVTDLQIHLQMTQVKAGNYYVYIYDQTGKKVYAKNLAYDGKPMLTIPCPTSFTAGNYQLQLTDGISTNLSTSLIIR